MFYVSLCYINTLYGQNMSKKLFSVFLKTSIRLGVSNAIQTGILGHLLAVHTCSECIRDYKGHWVIEILQRLIIRLIFVNDAELFLTTCWNVDSSSYTFLQRIFRSFVLLCQIVFICSSSISFLLFSTNFFLPIMFSFLRTAKRRNKRMHSKGGPTVCVTSRLCTSENLEFLKLLKKE